MKYLFLYRSILFRGVTFKTTSKEKDIQTIINALNIKKRKKRIAYVIEEACDHIDNCYKGDNICQFKNNKCACHRAQKRENENGCCYKCRYQSTKGCTTKNVACKLFFCSYAKKNITPIQEKDIKILKVLTPKDRCILKSDYFSTIEEVTKDLCWGYLISGLRIEYRFQKMKHAYKRKQRYEK